MSDERIEMPNGKSWYHVFEASHPGICDVCGNGWERGEPIRLGYKQPEVSDLQAVWMHVECSRLSDDEKQARTVPPSVSEDRRHAVVVEATSRVNVPPACGRVAHQTEHGTWPCIRAAGHDGDCKPDIDAAYYAQPIDTLDRDRLVVELHSWISQYESLARTYLDESMGHSQQFGRLIRELIRLAPANGKRKTVPADEVRRAWQEAL